MGTTSDPRRGSARGNRPVVVLLLVLVALAGILAVQRLLQSRARPAGQTASAPPGEQPSPPPAAGDGQELVDQATEQADRNPFRRGGTSDEPTEPSPPEGDQPAEGEAPPEQAPDAQPDPGFDFGPTPAAEGGPPVPTPEVPPVRTGGPEPVAAAEPATPEPSRPSRAQLLALDPKQLPDWVDPAAPSSGELKLVGVILARRPAALFLSSGEYLRVQVGEQVQSYRLERVTPNEAFLLDGATRFRLPLSGGAKLGGSRSAAATPVAEAAPPTPAPEPPSAPGAPEPRPAPEIRPPGGQGALGNAGGQPGRTGPRRRPGAGRGRQPGSGPPGNNDGEPSVRDQMGSRAV